MQRRQRQLGPPLALTGRRRKAQRLNDLRAVRAGQRQPARVYSQRVGLTDTWGMKKEMKKGTRIICGPWSAPSSVCLVV
jgi:hypothetical protein